MERGTWNSPPQRQATVLIDHGAPPLLGYAVACSVAWHLQDRVLFVAPTDARSDSLERYARCRPPASHARGCPPGADIEAYAPDALTADGGPTRILQRHPGYAYVLAQVHAPPPGLALRQIHLNPSSDVAALNGDGRPGHALVVQDGPSRRHGPDEHGIIVVPPLQAIDECHLQSGLLPRGTPAADAIGWLARDLIGRKIGLALGAGTAKGYAHIGVLHALERAGVPIDYVAGSSIGACVASAVAVGYSPDEMPRLLDELGATVWKLGLPAAGLLSSSGMRAGLQAAAGSLRIESLTRPLAIIAADLHTRQEVVFRRGLLWPALLASVSMPGIFPAQRMGPHALVDGGVVNPVPSRVVRELGADVVIAVRLRTRRTHAPVTEESIVPDGRAPSMFQAIMRTIDIMQSRIAADGLAAADVVIDAAFDDVEMPGLRNFGEGKRFIPLGQSAAEAAIPGTRSILPWIPAGDGT